MLRGIFFGALRVRITPPLRRVSLPLAQMKRNIAIIAILMAALLFVAPLRIEATSASDSAGGGLHCATCHDMSVQKFAKASAPVLDSSQKDVHSSANVGCLDCHASHNSRTDEGARPGIETCRTCHPESVQNYEIGMHFDAFGQLGLPHCTVCHEPHRVTPPDSNYAKIPAAGFSAKPRECLSCHFEGSRIAGLVVQTAGARERLAVESRKFDSLVKKLERAEQILPAPLKTKDFPENSGGDFINRARIESHSQSGAVEKILTECMGENENLSEAIRKARLAALVFYGLISVVAIAAVSIAAAKLGRKARSRSIGASSRR